MYTPSNFHTRESYVLKCQIHDPDTPTYMEAPSGENADEYYKAMDDGNKSLMRSDTWEIFQGIQLIIKMCFHGHFLSSARGNMIG